ncbi:Carbohydrate sulfotransferase 12 [Oryzias melastigma]|uniref:Carbohydrate sulfotransferase n=1 Tax=Oryzias melastigma TaxID=30732 RepID=A0A834BV08_ORYME|nr:Carbohydrate sulfotransferase 12 [Oryzias melastigma]
MGPNKGFMAVIFLLGCMLFITLTTHGWDVYQQSLVLRSTKRQYLRKDLLRKYCAGVNQSLDDLRDIDFKNFIVDDKHGIIYCYIPKVACTNWKRTLIALNNSEPYPDPMSFEHNWVHHFDRFKLLKDFPQAERKPYSFHASVDEENDSVVERSTLRSTKRQRLRKDLLRKYCKGGNQSLDDLKDTNLTNFIVDDKHGIVYCYIPKVACTNWKRTLIALNYSEPYPDPMVFEHNWVHQFERFQYLNDFPKAERKGGTLSSHCKRNDRNEVWERSSGLEDVDNPNVVWFKGKGHIKHRSTSAWDAVSEQEGTDKREGRHRDGDYPLKSLNCPGDTEETSVSTTSSSVCFRGRGQFSQHSDKDLL